MHRTRLPVALSLLLLLLSGTGTASAADSELATCAAIGADRQRLACYDRLAARAAPPAAEAVPAPRAPEPAAPAVVVSSAPAPESSALAHHWELGDAYSRGTFILRTHRPTYLVAATTSSPNERPYEPFRALDGGDIDLSPTELAFQLSLKLKFADNPFNFPADLWFGYTQRSYWQAFNKRISSPFRATDYQPEVMAVFPTDMKLLGLRLRMVNLGFIHESNGQAASLSRSWNRVYAQFGLERGDFSMLVRPWVRIHEDREDDDNPDIIDYLGRGDVAATYRWGRHELSLLTRYNFSTGRGAAQVGWAFPLGESVRRLKGYVHLFSGYGYSLIDYDHAQTVFGIGVMLDE